METWNREELYAEVWDQPLVKVAPKYGLNPARSRTLYRRLQVRNVRFSPEDIRARLVRLFRRGALRPPIFS
jgi:hypothetical protein